MLFFSFLSFHAFGSHMWGPQEVDMSYAEFEKTARAADLIAGGLGSKSFIEKLYLTISAGAQVLKPKLIEASFRF
jgi:hypothetical protein